MPVSSVNLPTSQGLESILQQVYALLAEVVNLPDVDQEYRAALHRVLTAAQTSERARFSPTVLPLLTCQAAGGQLHEALSIAAAWRALHIAIQLLETGDRTRIGIAPADSAQVVNLSMGFIIVASLALARLPSTIWPTLQHDFNRTILRIAGGWYADLTQRATFDLDEYFQVIAAKSGSFFGLAARAGAYCVTRDEPQIAKYDQFGYNVGVLIQITNDLSDFHKPLGQGSLSRGQRTLPVLYALGVASLPERTRLEQLLASMLAGKQVERQARQLIVALGAEVYLRAETTSHRSKALAALTESVNSISPSDKPLRDWLEALPVAI